MESECIEQIMESLKLNAGGLAALFGKDNVQ